jgi:hypothetical protein
MEPREPQLRSDLPDSNSATAPRDRPLLRMPIRMLGRIATRAINDVRQFLEKEISLNKATAQNADPADTVRQAEYQRSRYGALRSRRSNYSADAMQQDQVNHTIDNLKKVVKQSREILALANTVILPMNIFPDTVMVDRTRITIVKRTFFWSADVISISIDDVLNVSTSVGPFFGSVNISSRVMNSTDHFQINYFWRKDAMHLKHIIQGYVIAHQNGIATDQLSCDQLIETLLELGKEDHA